MWTFLASVLTTSLNTPWQLGRENPLVAKYFIDDHPAVLRLIELVVKESGDAPVSICGELASRIDGIPRLLKTGIRSLSVSGALVPDVKNAIQTSKCI